jgi:hypothetical protein
MKTIIFFIILTVAGYTFFYTEQDASGLNDGSQTKYYMPEMATGKRKGSGIKNYEFTTLFEQNKPYSKLAKEGYYTVIEGYINTCSICKQIEAEFPAFLNKRKDVLIRKVHFPEGGNNISFNGSSQEEVMRQMEDYYQRLGRYNNHYVVKKNNQYELTICGTPHIEIYGPDKQLIVTDKCGKKNKKSGLAFLRKWMKDV